MEVLKKINNKNMSKSYVMGICKHKIKDYYRFKYKTKIISLFNKVNDTELELLDNISLDIDIEKDIITKEDIAFIWNYLKKKNVIISKIFYLYYYMDYDIKEIAKVLHISESNVKNNLYRTLKELKGVINNEK